MVKRVARTAEKTHRVPDLYVRASDGVQLAVYVSGPQRGSRPPLILVHGYPDSASVWSSVRKCLGRRWRVIVYDVRGSGLSGEPGWRQRRSGYKMDQLASDLMAVADATCGVGNDFHLVAHDWGSIQCWDAVTDPHMSMRIRSFTSISGPCLDHAFLKPKMSIRQLLKSWYIVVFHLPLVAPLWWSLVGARLWPWYMRRTEGLRVERDENQRRNGVNGLQLYRANFVPRWWSPRERHTQVPVQFVVPRGDRYVDPSVTEGHERWLLGGVLRVEVRGQHWTTITRDGAFTASRIERFLAMVERRGLGPRRVDPVDQHA